MKKDTFSVSEHRNDKQRAPIRPVRQNENKAHIKTLKMKADSGII